MNYYINKEWSSGPDPFTQPLHQSPHIKPAAPALPNSSELFVGNYCNWNTAHRIPRHRFKGTLEVCMAVITVWQQTIFRYSPLYFQPISASFMWKAVQQNYLSVFKVDHPTWLILTFHQLFNDKDKAGLGRFMTALALCTHSCTWQVRGPLQGWCWCCWWKWELHYELPPPGYLDRHVYIWYFPSSDGHTRRTDTSLAQTNILFSRRKCELVLMLHSR